MFELSRLFRVNHDSPEYNSRGHAGVLYSQSWALVHMLSMDNRYRPGWPQFRDLVGAGADSAAALTQVYGKTPEQVGRDLANYVTRDQYSAYETKDKYEVAQAKKYETRPADAFEGELVTANLVANSLDGEERARAAYAKLEGQKPDALPLLEARAYFEWRRGSREAALPYFERAIANGTQNLELLRDYMRLEPSKAEAALPKALALAPNDPDVRIEQAAVLMRERKSSQAVLTLRDVLKTLDNDQSFRAYQILANAYMQLNQIDDARMAATQVARVAENASEADFANRMLASINTFAEDKAAFDARSRAATAAADAGARIAGQPGEPALPPLVAAPRVTGPLVTPQMLPGGAQVVMVSGRLRNIVSCTDGAHAILEVLSNGQTLRLYIDDGLKVAVRGQSGGTIDLSCRAYDTPIKVGYEPVVDAQRNTIGYVRVLDYGP
jgi:tetratricopeptide (TPR) repeat protein